MNAPLHVLTRPFAIEPVTNIMLPDGIFDNALYKLRIACHFTNNSNAPVNNVDLYLESVGDPGIVVTANTHHYATIPAGASVMVAWDADFQNSTPGKHLISFVARADGFSSQRSLQNIFVSQTRYDHATNSYTCTIEEGTLTMSKVSAITSKADWSVGQSRDNKDCKCAPSHRLRIPTGMTLVWTPNPNYTGTHGDLPFSDPWWKILALIIAIIAAIVAIVAAATGHGTASGTAEGTFDETQPSVHCCAPAASDADSTVAGVASAIAAAALAVALSDDADPWWRGQQATPPGSPAELTTGEKVVAKWSLVDAPNAGKPYQANVKWEYTRFTNLSSYNFSVDEQQTNIHISNGVEIDLPASVKAFSTLWVRAKFQKTGGAYYKGNELYAFALFRAPQGLYFVVNLGDDGLGYDPAANDSIYAGSLQLESAYRLLLQNNQDIRGLWRVYVYAQDVNLTKPGTPPEIAAKHIGGFFVASAITINFDPSLPCPLESQGTILVV